jgi:hypothetical protein
MILPSKLRFRILLKDKAVPSDNSVTPFPPSQCVAVCADHVSNPDGCCPDRMGDACCRRPRGRQTGCTRFVVRSSGSDWPRQISSGFWYPKWMTDTGGGPMHTPESYVIRGRIVRVAQERSNNACASIDAPISGRHSEIKQPARWAGGNAVNDDCMIVRV